MRIDKYLWCVRLFKTREVAIDAVKSGRVRVGESQVKPARELKEGEVLTIRRGPAMLQYRVKGFPKGRVGAPLVPDYLLDITPESEKAKLQEHNLILSLQRDRGTGRPTKKERRAIDELYAEGYLDDGWEPDDGEEEEL
jgi:hypothetical protein